MLPQALQQLGGSFKQFNGVGHRSSQKLALDVLEMEDEDYQLFLDSIVRVKKEVTFCHECGFFAQISNPDNHLVLCDICQNKNRNKWQICLVEKPIDVINMERSQSYPGQYHVLKHLISPLDNIFPENTNILSLIHERLPKILKTLTGQKENEHVELILFFKPSFATEATTAYLKETLNTQGLLEKIAITKLAQGLPLYYNAETLDQATLAKALQDRKVI